MSDSDKQALINGTATIQTKLEIVVEDDDNIILTEDNSVVSWNHEDFRYVKDQGWIGQFVARQLTGELKDLDDDFSITDKELILKLGVRTNNNTNWYSLGNFLVTKVTNDEVSDKTTFEALDYTKKFNKIYEDTIEYPCTALQLAQNVCNQCGVQLGSLTFKNSDYQITGNPFQNNETCRDVMKAIGKLAFSWVRIDWDNKVYIDFEKATTVNQYDDFGNNKYYTLKTQKSVFGPVDKIIIGYSQIEGEKTYIGQEDGECELTVYDNPLVFTQEQRESIINSASDLLGLTYTPLNTLTVGHPWLKGKELISVTDMENVAHTTIPFDRTIQYFGHIKTLINSVAPTKTESTLAYPSDVNKKIAQAEIEVNKIAAEVRERVSTVETEINEIITTTQTSTGNNNLYITEALEQNAIEYSVDGATEQNSYSGKNLLDTTNFQQTTLNGITSSYDPITQEITFNGTCTANNTTFAFNLPNIAIDGTNTLSYVVIGGTITNPTGSTRIQFQRSSDWTGITVELKQTNNSTTKTLSNLSCNSNNIRFDNGVSVNNYKIKIQLEKNSAATEWERYVGGKPSPNPDYPQEIKTIPSIRNLLNYETSVNGSIPANSTSETLNSDSHAITSAWIPCKPNITYTISGGKNRNRWQTKASDGTISYFTSDSATITTNSTAKYLRCYYYYASSSIDPQSIQNVQIEEGPIAHEYVPYGTYARVKVTGKNLFNLVNTYSRNGVTYTFNNSTLIINGTSSGEGGLTPLSESPKVATLKAGTYKLSFTRMSGTLNGTSNIIIRNLDTQTNLVDTVYGASTKYTFTLTSATNIGFNLYQLGSGRVYDNYEIGIQIEEGSATTYEDYKEKEVLINLASSNLFNKDTALIGYSTNSNGELVASAGNFTSEFIKVEPNTDYYVTQSICVVLGYDINKTFIGEIRNVNSAGTFNTGEAEYIRVRDWWYSSESVLNTQLNNAMLNKGTIGLSYQPYYYELCKIGDYKDILSIDENGNCVIDKKIGKVVLNESSSLTTHAYGTNSFQIKLSNILTIDNQATILSNYFKAIPYVDRAIGTNTIYTVSNDNNFNLVIRNTDFTSLANFQTWLSTHNTEVYYVLNTPETITLSNTKIPLFEGINHVTLVDDLDTSTSITFYRNTPISDTYALQTSLNDTNSNLSDTNSQLGQAQSDISQTRTDLNNNYYTQDQIDTINSTTEEKIVEIRNTVERTTTATSEQIDIINQTLENGVTKVDTKTGYTFDSEGLKIAKTGSEMNSLLDNDGLVVKRNNDEVLSVRSSGVETENLTVRTHLVQKPIRMEKTRSISDSTKVGLGFFYVGE